MPSRRTTLGFRLRRIRNFRGYSIRHVARKLGMSPIQLSEWERNIRKPNTDNIVNLAVFYGVMVDELLFDLKQDAVRAIHGSPGNPYGEYYALVKNRPP